jgi:hypothetical protein
MSRRKRILLVAAAALLVVLYLAGVGLGQRGKPREVSIDRWKERIPERALEAAELVDPGGCIARAAAPVTIRGPCTLRVDSTWSLRRRVLRLRPQGPGSPTVRVVPADHPEREVPATLDAGDNALPIDRSGATIQLMCTPSCAVTLR